jgi:hypothetical protein
MPFDARYQYQTLEVVDENDRPFSQESLVKEDLSWQMKILFHVVQFTFFLLSFYFITMSAFDYFLFSPEGQVDRRRHLLDETNTAQQAQTCNWKNALILTGAGAAIGAGVVVGGFAIVGLSATGPIAGGWFAANMGAGLASGSAMSVLQSAAMTGTAYGVGSATGAVGSALIACKIST